MAQRVQKDRIRWSEMTGYLSNRHQDNVGGHNLDDVDLKQPPDEKLQFMEVLQKLQEQHS